MVDTTPHNPTEVTRAEVCALLSFGNTQQEICDYLGISDKTFLKYYDYEWKTAIVRANANVAKRLYNKAVVQDDLSAQIFWLKTRARWRTADSEHDQKVMDEHNAQVKLELKALRDKLDKANIAEY